MTLGYIAMGVPEAEITIMNKDGFKKSNHGCMNWDVHNLGFLNWGPNSSGFIDRGHEFVIQLVPGFEFVQPFFFFSHLEDKVVFEGLVMICTKRVIRELVREFVSVTSQI